ncbi:amidohydrolase [Thalassotalea fonticola]|uniref:Amidohydrolase n=1 Tax=Thalassotalea fonticola TaxID=3065649 RepID=A0ABZ0GLV4_9GAMM|nr:amidohydrolase [Colwelliaceae bacterium S1-1]
MNKVLAIVALSILLSACTEPVPEAEMSLIDKADLVFFGGDIYTVNEAQPWADSVAIKDGEIVYVGDKAGLKVWVNADTKQRDLKGKMLLPGFIDSHAHPVMGGAYVRSLSLDTFATPKQWQQQVKDYAEQNKDATVLFGYGFLASAFGPEGPNKAMLDEVVADKAVYIMDEGFHGAWANSKAIELLGINKDTPDPVPGFSYYKRDDFGEPTGYLLEDTATAAVKALDIITTESVAKGTADVIDIMNSYGITSVFDAGALDVESLQLNVLKEIVAQDQMSIRLVGAHMVSSVATMDEAVATAAHKKAITKNERFHINMLKIMNDGTIEGKTAGMFEDYQGEPGNKGETVFNQQQMNTMLTAAAAKDIDVHIHALGERAISESLNAIEVARQTYPKSTNRYAICHIQVMADADIERFAKLNVIAQSTPLWSSYDAYGKEFVSDDQFNRYFRFNSLKQAKVKMSFGSDFPASGAGTLGISPIFNMEIGLTRQEVGNPQAPVQPGKDERLDVATLIKGYTLDAAYQLRLENSVGSIEVGKKADLVLLDKNLFAVDSYDIHKVVVLETILEGKTVYGD